MTNRVTVVIPTRNRRESIERCLRGLDAQTLTGFEAIVVNDGSDDSTASFLDDEQLVKRAFSLVVIHHKQPQGANPSRNDAIAHATGTLIAFLDDDCDPLPNWLENLLAGFTSDKVAATTGYVENRELSNLWERFFIGQHRVSATIVDGVSHARRLVAGNMMVRREHLSNALDEDRAEVPTDVQTSARGDEEGLRIRLQRDGKTLVYCPKAIVHHFHPYTATAFFRQAYTSGLAACRLERIYALSPRWELICLALAIIAAALAIVEPWLGVVSGAFFSLFFVAASYNELALKKKSFLEWVSTLLPLIIYYIARTAGYVFERIARR